MFYVKGINPYISTNSGHFLRLLNAVGISSYFWWFLKMGVLKAHWWSQLHYCKYTKNHWRVHFTRVNCRVCEFHLMKLLLFKKSWGWRVLNNIIIQLTIIKMTQPLSFSKLSSLIPIHVCGTDIKGCLRPIWTDIKYLCMIKNDSKTQRQLNQLYFR